MVGLNGLIPGGGGISITLLLLKYENSFTRVHYTGWSKVSVHLMITIEEVTSNVQSVPRLTAWLSLTVWQPTARARGTLDPH
jgi:hypothetical protein